MELGELIAALGAYVADEDGGSDEEKLKAVVKEMRGHENPNVKAIAQRLVNAGAKLTKTDGEKRVRALEAELTEAKSATEELTQRLETAEANKGKPSEKEAELQRRLERAEKKLGEVTQERDTERQGRQQDTVEKSRTAFLAQLNGRVDDFGKKAVERMYADRFRSKEGGGVEVLDEDGEVIDPPKGQTAEEVLAEQAYNAVPDSNRLRNLQPGGGVNGRGGGQSAPSVEQLVQEKRQTRKAFL